MQNTILTTDDYYNPQALLSHGAMWNLVVGARGLGKTFAFKRWGVKNYLKSGKQFFYLRRYDTEQHGKETFFDDLREFFPDYMFRINGNKGQISPKAEPDEAEWGTCCYFGALSQAGNIKSVPYPDVTLLIYDEAIPNNSRYLSNEAKQFSELYSTIDRWKDKTRVVMLANAVTLSNPYFAHYSIDMTGQLDAQQQFHTYCNGYFCVELADYGGFSSKVATTRFGRFITDYDPEYAQYAMNNSFQDASESLVQAMPDAIDPVVRIHTRDMGEFTLYMAMVDSPRPHTQYWISQRLPKHAGRVTFDPRAVDEDTILVSRSTPIIQHIRSAYNAGELLFDTVPAKTAFQQVLGGLI